MSEFDIYPLFEKWVSKRCEYVFSRVKPKRCNNIEFDIVGVSYKWENRKDFRTLTSIEVKETDFDKCYQQALKRKEFCEYCYMAFPLDFVGFVIYKIGERFDEIRKNRIGVLFCDNRCENRVWSVLYAGMNRKVKEEQKDLLMRELDYNKLIKNEYK